MDRQELAVMRAAEAQQLKDNPMFAKAFDDTRTAMLEAWAALDKADERATELHRMVKCLERVRRCLEIHIDTGKIANKEIEGRKLFGLRRA